MGDHEHAVRAAQRELAAFPAMFGWNFAVEVIANFRLGQAHHSLGQYSRAVDYLRKNLELLVGDLLQDRYHDMAALPSVLSRVWLALCLAERGEFDEGLALGEEALRIAEIGDPGFSFVLGCAGLGNVCVAKGDFDRAVAVLERGLSREADEPTHGGVAIRRLGFGSGIHARRPPRRGAAVARGGRSSGRRP